MRVGPGAAAALLAALAAVPAAASRGTSASRLPYTVSIRVAWGEGAGSDAFRSDLEHALAVALQEACFRRVDPAGAGDTAESEDLRLAVVLSNVVDVTTFEDSIATALSPDDPAQSLRRVARYAVDVAASLTAEAGGAEVVTTRMHADVSWRPLVVGEDPRERAREDALRTIVRDLRRPLCEGRAASRRIREAMERTQAAAPAR